MKSLISVSRMAVFLLALSLCACDSDNSNTTQSTLINNPGAVGFNGDWSGRPVGRENDGVFVTLTQRGNRIVGEGALFRGDDPTPVQVVGSTSMRGTILDLLTPEGQASDARLSLKPGIDQLNGRFTDLATPAGVDFSLLREFQSAGSSGQAQQLLVQGSVDGQAYNISVNVTRGPGNTLEGQWQSSNIRLGDDSAGGRASGALNVWKGWSYLNLQDEAGPSLPAGTLWFREQALDPDSFLFVANQGRLKTSGTVQEVTP